MFKLIKKINKELIFIGSSISLMFLILFFYNYKITNNKKIINPGFQSASSIKNNTNICNGDLSKVENSKCIIYISQEFKKNKNKNNILFLGNSQTGAINNFIKNDENYISIINKNSLIIEKFANLKSIWLPNATLKEFSEIIKQFNNCDLKIDLLFLPIFLDDTRTDTNREGINNYASTICEYKTLNKKVKEEKKGNLYYLNKNLENNLIFSNNLDKLNQDLKINIYKLRNFIFNIRPDTARPIVESSYKSNLESLIYLLENRGSKELITILYIPPLLNAKSEGKIPYFISEYNKFKSDIENICKRKFCIYLNLEDIIPNQFWGNKNSTSLFQKSEIDFMHFTGLGHEILANYFIDFLINNKIPD